MSKWKGLAKGRIEFDENILLEDKIIFMIGRILGIDTEEITTEVQIHQLCDELDLIEIVMSIELQFDMMIPDEDFTTFGTVGGLIKYVNKKKYRNRKIQNLID